MDKKPPTAMPPSNTKTIVTPSVLAKGHTTNILVPSNAMDVNKTFRAPTLSLKTPEPIRPTADAALNAAAIAAPVLEDKPMDSANRGMQ